MHGLRGAAGGAPPLSALEAASPCVEVAASPCVEVAASPCVEVVAIPREGSLGPQKATHLETGSATLPGPSGFPFGLPCDRSTNGEWSEAAENVGKHLDPERNLALPP